MVEEYKFFLPDILSSCGYNGIAWASYRKNSFTGRRFIHRIVPQFHQYYAPNNIHQKLNCQRGSFVRRKNKPN
jgi:hypothetical protein